MTADRAWDLQALPGFAAVRTYAQLSRDLAELWSGASQQMILLSVETNETAMAAVRATFGPAALPSAEVWNWWASATAGFLGAYQDLVQRRPVAGPPSAALPPVELDLTQEEPPVDVRARERVAAAEVDIPQATASTTRRRRSSGSAAPS
jgi:hypothetical protein